MIQNKILSLFAKINQKPVFVLGNQKSGTTVISNLLSQATCKSLTCDFQRAIPHKTLQLELGFRLLKFSDFINEYKYEFSKDIIKEPFLSFFINDLINEFPKAKFILIIRDPFQNIRSILNRLDIPGNLQKIDFDHYNEIIKTPVWKLALQSYMLKMDSSNYIEAMANRWNYVVNSYLNNSNKIHLVKYEDFLKNKEKFIYDLSESVGLKSIKNIKNNINIQYQHKGDNTINLQKFFGELNYAKISRLCDENMRKIGY